MPHAIFDYQDMIEPMGAGYSAVSSTAPSTWGGTQNEYSQMLGQLGISGGYTKPSPIVGSNSGSSSGGGYSIPSKGGGVVYNPPSGGGGSGGGGGGCPAGYSSGSPDTGNSRDLTFDV
jgi:hypothetical protein